jgi:hypothetical protein
MLDTEKYTLTDGKTPLSAAELNARFWALVRRLHALETLSINWASAVAEVQNHGVERINETIVPLMDSLRAEMDALLAQGRAEIEGHGADVAALLAQGDTALTGWTAAVDDLLHRINTTVATTVIAGVVKLATSAEGVAGTDAARAVTPAVSRQAFASWLRDETGQFAGVIPPTYNLYAPSLALPSGTTFARASSGLVVGVVGGGTLVGNDVPRFDHDLVSGRLRGLVIEGAATRLNTVSAYFSGTVLSVTAQPYTVSWYGPGRLLLTGAHLHAVDGNPDILVRNVYTFTPVVGMLMLDVEYPGTIRNFQIEAGPSATSLIPGEGAQVARAADVCSVALSGIDFNPAEGTVFCDFMLNRIGAVQRIIFIDDGSLTNYINVHVHSTNKIFCRSVVSGIETMVVETGEITSATRYRLAFSFKSSSLAVSLSGGAPISRASPGALPSGLTTLRIGNLSGNTQPMFGLVRQAAYFPRALTAAQLQAMTL